MDLLNKLKTSDRLTIGKKLSTNYKAQGEYSKKTIYKSHNLIEQEDYVHTDKVIRWIYQENCRPTDKVINLIEQGDYVKTSKFIR